MAKIYIPNIWVDEVLADTETYSISGTGGSPMTSASIVLETTVVQAGTALTAARMNNIESGVDSLDTLVDALNTITNDLDDILTNTGVTKLSTSGSETLTVGSIVDGEYLKRVGNTISSASAGGGGGTTDIAATIHAADSKNPPIDADELGLVDSATSNTLKKLTWANLKATLKTYFDTLYMVLVTPGTSGNVLKSNGSAWTSGSDISISSAATIHAATAGSPADADEFCRTNSASSYGFVKSTWSNIKATLKTYFDTLYVWTTVTHAASAKSPPVDADEFSIVDSEASNGLKKLTLAALKSVLKTYQDTLYASIASPIKETSGPTVLTTGAIADGQYLARSGGSVIGVDLGSNREILTANRTYYVATTGNDSNNGLSSGSPFLTIQNAIDVVAALDLSIYDVTIQLAAGTYANSTGNRCKPCVGAGSVTIIGDETTPANVVVTSTTTTGAGAFYSAYNPQTIYKLRGMTISGACTNLISSTYGSNIEIQNIVFGLLTVGTAHLYTFAGGRINVTGNYSITGGTGS